MKPPPPNRKRSASSSHKEAIAALVFVLSCGPTSLLAQSIVPDTTLPGGIMSNVATNGSRADITGGLSVGGNLFHSFSDFQIGNGSTANFRSQGANNILSRVTGSNRSNISGTIGVDIGQVNRSNANLFFLNPNGVVFGSTASLDLNGSFHVSTADSIQLGTGPGAGLFSADGAIPDMLTSAPPSAFGFSNSNPLASISVSGATLQVQPGKIISIIGGDAAGLPADDPQGNLIADSNTGVHISASTIAAPNGHINLVSVAAPGTVSTTGPELTPNFPLTTFTELGAINITDESMIDVRGNSPGAVVIRGGRLTLNNRAQITASTSGANNAGNVSINVSENVMIKEGSHISTSTIGRGSGNAGDVTISATGDVMLSGTTGALSSQISSSAIESTLAGADLLGSGGTITITAQNVTLKDGAKVSVKSGELQSVRQINTTENLPSAGTVDITAVETLRVSGANTTSPLAQENSPIIPTEITAAANGPAATGTIRAEARNIIIEDGGVIAADINSTTPVAKRGIIALKAHEKLLLTGAATRADFLQPAPNTLSIINDNLIINLSAILANTIGTNLGAEVSIDAKNVEISEGANISAISFLGEAQGGDVTINSTETVRLSGAYEFTNRSGSVLRSRIGTETRTNGKAGDITINANNVELMNGAEISAISIGRGSQKVGGNVAIHATENLTLSGFSEVTNTRLGNNQPPTRDVSSRITSTSTEAASRPPNTFLGSGGDITVTGSNVVLTDGASIEAKGFGNKDTEENQAQFIANNPGIPIPQTGNVTVMADQLVVSGARDASSSVPSEISTSASGSIGTGNLTIMANNISIRDGGRLSAATSSRTTGVNRGSITLTANETLSISGSSQNLKSNRMFLSSIQAGTSGTNQAGDITVNTSNLKITNGGLILTNSSDTINPDFLQLGAAGAIAITAETIELQEGATITSSATGLGEAGDITLKAETEILLDEASLLTKATIASGGNIKLDASNLIFVKDSRIESSVLGNEQTKGGNISIDPQFILVNNSQILATAAAGAGGAITLVGDVIFQDSLSNIKATAGPAGIDGSVNIQAPIQNLSQAIAPLPETIVEVAALYSAQCAGQKNGQFSSFTQQGLDRIPFEPGELLPTPLLVPNLTPNQTKKSKKSSSPMVQRLKLPGFDSATPLVSTWNFSRGGCRS